MDFDVVIVRYGEIGIKSEQVRRKFEALLIENIRAMLEFRGVAFKDIVKERGRIFVHTSDEKAPEVVGNVFGVVSTSAAITAGPTMEEAAAVAVSIGKEIIKDNQSFGIMGRRSGNQPFTSQDIGRACGDAVFEAVRERNPKVDLKHADHNIHVEIRDTQSYIFTRYSQGRRRHAAGLPGQNGRHDIGRHRLARFSMAHDEARLRDRAGVLPQ